MASLHPSTRDRYRKRGAAAAAQQQKQQSLSLSPSRNKQKKYQIEIIIPGAPLSIQMSFPCLYIFSLSFRWVVGRERERKDYVGAAAAAAELRSNLSRARLLLASRWPVLYTRARAYSACVCVCV